MFFKCEDDTLPLNAYLVIVILTSMLNVIGNDRQCIKHTKGKP